MLKITFAIFCITSNIMMRNNFHTAAKSLSIFASLID